MLHRQFGGKRYKWRATAYSKREALKKARTFRKQGNLVRIVKGRAWFLGAPKSTHRDVYRIYIYVPRSDE
jgi:hypothetical protein